jgi:Skp family chaperone for outer membrane proteins
VPSPVVTVDQERLFTDSAWGRRVQTEVETRSRVLSAENRQIEEELIAEEQALTDLRQEMEPEAFRERAEAFDAKVQRLRAEQDAKTRELTAFREAERQRFFSEVLEVLTDVVTERGAVVILDQRAIVLSVAAIDITDAAIARIDATMGDGRQP